ncbi:hypothetical protein CPT03_10710 [Pedobacter ginsengisoli]|uniref:Uncharacterized protein n=2 Tax=Pedobacter ginsengisoli TaxID=363852 RepID=A0A2D1U5M5_9SPHI|nr:hypothetical protein CPT03_10710 [Pedobacter ginsengisoli]
MDITYKSIIIRESLVFTAVLLLSLFAFLFTYAYNWYYNQRINKLSSISLSNMITADSLSNFYQKKESKQIWFFNKLGVLTPHSTPEEVFKRLYAVSQVDSVGHKWNGSWKYMIPFLKSIGFDSHKRFKKFIDENNISNEDVSNLSRSVELTRLNQEIDVEKNKALDKIFSYNEKIKLFWLVFVCLFVFAFFIRFIL